MLFESFFATHHVGNDDQIFVAPLKIEERAKQRVITAKAEAEAMTIQSQALSANAALVQWEAVKKWNEGLVQKTLTAEREKAAQVDRQAANERQFKENTDRAGAAIEAAGGEKFLEKVAPTMERIVKAAEKWREDGKFSPLKELGDWMLNSGEAAAFVMEALHDNPEILDSFEEIGLAPESRQASLLYTQLAQLVGTLKALEKVKAHATADKPGSATIAFKPRAPQPVPSVAGRPHTPDPDLSKAKSLDEYVGLVGVNHPSFRR